MAVPFCPGLRELEVLPKGSIRIASLLSRVEVPPGILLAALLHPPPSSTVLLLLLCRPFYPGERARESSSFCPEDTRFLGSLFSSRLHANYILRRCCLSQQPFFFFLSFAVRVNGSRNFHRLNSNVFASDKLFDLVHSSLVIAARP